MFYTLSIKDIRQETEDCRSIAFEVPAKLSEKFKFTQGQYLTLRAEINGQDVRRSYSICSSPLDGELRVAIKKIENGKFSTFAHEILKTGDTLDSMVPMGTFYSTLEASQKKHYIGVATGSGITPIMSIMKTVLQIEPNSHFTLLYGNRNTGSILFREEIQALKNQYIDRLSVFHFLSRERLDTPMFNGRIDGEKCLALNQKLIDLSKIDEFFLCGVQQMMFSVKEALESLQVDAKKVHFELFTSPDGMLGNAKRKKRTVEKDKVCKVSVTVEGSSFDFDLDFGANNLLDAAMAEGADLPFACKGGVCCTCKAKVLEGEVEMEVNYALEKEEVEAGFILSCQAYPKTERVVLDFDQL